MTKLCPKCGSEQAYMFVRWSVKTGELYNVKTCELVMPGDLTDSALPIKSLRTVECAKCGAMYRLSDEQYEAMRW